MRERSIQYALHYGILVEALKLEADLLKIEGIHDVDIGVDNYDEIEHIIVVPHYVLPVDAPDYYQRRRVLLENILTVCGQHDLWPTGDRIEDYGEHWYIVRRAGKSWPRALNKHNMEVAQHE